MRRKIVAGNWKMNGSREFARRMIDGLSPLAEELKNLVEIVVAPPFVLISDFTQDETLDISEIEPVSVPQQEEVIDIIGDDIPDELNFIPMASDNESEPAPMPKPEPEQVKVVAVSQPIAAAPQQQAQAPRNDGQTKRIIFAPGAMDLTDM